MLDFLKISARSKKQGVTEIYPRFIINNRSTDLMIRGGDFYAVWIEESGLWSTDEQDVIQMIDHELDKFADEYKQHSMGESVYILHMWDSETGVIDSWHKYCQKQMRDNFHPLDETLIFANTKTTKKDYASKRLKYPLEKGDTSAWNKLISTLYSPEERHKIEWAIGAVITGDSKWIQKFMVFYGAGNVTGWNDNGYFPVNNFTKLSGSNGEVTIIYQATINENHVKNSYWNTLLRTDAIQSGTIQCKMFKVERGTRYTDWTPAPEDVDSAINDVSESTNQYITDVSDSLGKTEEELADLKSNTNATLKLCVKEDETGRLKSMIEAIADTINITAKGGLNLTGNRFSVSSTNLTITKDGSMTCKKIVATGGTVGGWQIQSDGLYSMSGEQGSSLSLMNLGNFKGSSEDDLIISFRRWNTYPFYVTSGGELGCRKLAISVGYNKLNQRATTSANDTQAFNYAWTINGTGLFILNAGLWTDTTDDYGTTNCAIYVNGACVTSNTHRYGENSSSVELDAGATFVYWFRNANNQKVLLQAGSTKTGNKTLTYTVQGLFGLAVT